MELPSGRPDGLGLTAAEPSERRLRGAAGVGLSVRVHSPEAPGPPVLAVHGLASNARLWDGAAAELTRRGHPVAAVDQRGHGRSDKPDGGYDFETLAADLRAVVEQLGWTGRRVVAAGQSWGGNVVVELAARHAEVVASLVLVDGGTITLADRFADWPTCEAALAPPRLEGTPLAELEKKLRRAHPDWPEPGIVGTLANFEVRGDGTVSPWLSRAHHLTILRGLWEHRPLERLAGLHAPVLLVPAGEPAARRRAGIATREEIAAARAALGSSAVCWVDGDHDLHAQFPDRIGALVAAAADGSAFTAARRDR